MALNIKDPETDRLARSGNPVVRLQLDDLVAEAGLVLEPVTVDQSYRARLACEHFGKGHHPAGLNFGDCSPMPSPRRPARPCCSRAGILP